MRNIAFCIVMLLPLTACGPSALDGGFDSANPAARMYAIEHAVRNGDTGAVKHIVEQLDSDDPAVRFLAIGALERLTGQTRGYDHAAPAEQRQQAIARWETVIEDGSFIVTRHRVDDAGANEK